MMTKVDDHLAPLIRTMPDKPGIYQYFDREGRIIYIGKAKNLKKRVSSYFNKETSLSGKVRTLVKNIADIQHMVVDTELDAILLENNLIKKHQPRYNVQWKDDKTFPWICIKNERFPRIFPTRNAVQDGSQYFGPYGSVRMMKTLLELIRALYPLRNCTLNLSASNIERKKFRVCLEYHLGNCRGPCEGLQSEDDYQSSVTAIREIIKGNIHTVIAQLKEVMNDYANRLEFEKAHLVKEKIALLERYQSKSLVVNPAIRHADVYSIVSDDRYGYVNYIKVVNGAIVQAHTIEIRKKLDEPDEELLALAITDFRQRFSSTAPEMIIPLKMEMEYPDVIFTVPQRGDKKKLLELSERNARYLQAEKEKQRELVDPERHSRRILTTLMNDLRLKEIPNRIECFDNSNIQGHFPVAAMVVFKGGRPDKREYRHFNVRTVEGPDDYASMEEIVHRRYKRVLEEEGELPQLIIIDGGKGQLNAALNSLEKLGLKNRIAVIGIAKKLEEIYYPNDPLPLYLNKKSESLKLIQQLRDEAHRFGITHHRKRREKGTLKTELTQIPGIGSKHSQGLLRRFRSVEGVRKATLEEIQNAIGMKKGSVVFEYFKNKKA
ncbi:MAG TPA: excinuclease ABC subunit UvrC [Bacteroidales bacterium]|nr:excinuclease ABC subunit UvrC [Bacteroidales bacterium]HRZ20403.1 excinuclease ABC subunit UvrC [Bacteroidales bacterium]